MTRQAFVLGAGLGTRLKTLTQKRPKPLIPIVNRPLITHAFDHLIRAGVERLVINTHWRAETYAAAFPEGVYQGKALTFRHEYPEVLETAGGIKNVEDLLGGERFWVHNGDILSTIPIERAEQAHIQSGNEVTLVLRSHGGPLQVGFNQESGRVTDIGGRVRLVEMERFLFTGIYLVEPAFLARIPPVVPISVVPIFCEMIRTGAPLGAVAIDDGEWWDLGTREQILAVHAAFHAAQKVKPADWIHPAADVHRDADLIGATAVGAWARIGAGAQLRDTLVWDGAEVAAGAQLERCIVTTGARAEGSLRDTDVT
ncbi:MAG: sugar phosphate nucleotidyltransferase [Chthoniobacteraceae bacterium]